MRIALGVEYDGHNYRGWQRQNNVLSVQETVEAALSKVADHKIELVCAGRTDAGVHATSQVVHFDSDADRDEINWLRGANANLPANIAIHWAKVVSDDFHARFSAISRRYQYIILTQDVRTAILNKRVTWIRRALNVAHMDEAAKYLIGRHDFSSYRAAQCQAKSPICTIKSISVQRKKKFISIDVHANSFLYHMVRNIAGVLLEVGYGNKMPEWSLEVLKKKDRRSAGVTAEPWGLYLVHVEYPKAYQLQCQPRMPLYMCSF